MLYKFNYKVLRREVKNKVLRSVQLTGWGHVTRSHANKATFSPPFLHPPSPSTATNATPPTTDHTGEARGHGRRHTVGVQGMPAIFIFYLLFHLLRLDPQQPQQVPLHGKCADAPLLPPTTNLRCPPPTEHVPTSRTPERALVGTLDRKSVV